MALDPNKIGDISPVYSTDPTVAQQRLADMQALLAQVQANPANYPNAAYLLQELPKNIEAQTSVAEYARLSGIAPQYQNLVTSQQTYQNQIPVYVNILDIVSRSPHWNVKLPSELLQYLPPGAPSEGSKDYLINFYSTWLQNTGDALNRTNQQLQALGPFSSQALSSAQRDVVGKFRLTRPDVPTLTRQAQEYFYKPGGYIETAMQPLAKNIFSMRYAANNLSNEKLNRMGLFRGGARESEKSDIGSVALRGLGEARGGLESEAAGAISGYQKSLEDLANLATQRENVVRGGTLGDLYGGAYKTYASDWLTDLSTALARAGTDYQVQAAKSAEDDFLADIARRLGGAVGTGAGIALAGI
jgi:hypothetical protein